MKILLLLILILIENIVSISKTYTPNNYHELNVNQHRVYGSPLKQSKKIFHKFKHSQMNGENINMIVKARSYNNVYHVNDDDIISNYKCVNDISIVFILKKNMINIYDSTLASLPIGTKIIVNCYENSTSDSIIRITNQKPIIFKHSLKIVISINKGSINDLFQSISFKYNWEPSKVNYHPMIQSEYTFDLFRFNMNKTGTIVEELIEMKDRLYCLNCFCRLSAGINIEFIVDFVTITSFRVAFTGSLTGGVGFKMDIMDESDWIKIIDDMTLVNIVIAYVWGIPIKFNLKGFVDAKFSIKEVSKDYELIDLSKELSSLNSTATFDSTLTMGVEYINGVVQPISSFDYSYNFTKPYIPQGIQITAWIGLNLIPKLRFGPTILGTEYLIAAQSNLKLAPYVKFLAQETTHVLSPIDNEYEELPKFEILSPIDYGVYKNSEDLICTIDSLGFTGSVTVSYVEQGCSLLNIFTADSYTYLKTNIQLNSDGKTQFSLDINDIEEGPGITLKFIFNVVIKGINKTFMRIIPITINNYGWKGYRYLLWWPIQMQSSKFDVFNTANDLYIYLQAGNNECVNRAKQYINDENNVVFLPNPPANVSWNELFQLNWQVIDSYNVYNIQQYCHVFNTTNVDITLSLWEDTLVGDTVYLTKNIFNLYFIWNQLNTLRLVEISDSQSSASIYIGMDYEYMLQIQLDYINSTDSSDDLLVLFTYDDKSVESSFIDNTGHIEYHYQLLYISNVPRYRILKADVGDHDCVSANDFYKCDSHFVYEKEWIYRTCSHTEGGGTTRTVGYRYRFVSKSEFTSNVINKKPRLKSKYDLTTRLTQQQNNLPTIKSSHCDDEISVDVFVGLDIQVSVAINLSYSGNTLNILEWDFFPLYNVFETNILSICFNINYCWFNNCENDGICVDLHGDFKCICPSGWYGKTCNSTQPNCVTNTCLQRTRRLCHSHWKCELDECVDEIIVGMPCDDNNDFTVLDQCNERGECISIPRYVSTTQCKFKLDIKYPISSQLDIISTSVIDTLASAISIPSNRLKLKSMVPGSIIFTIIILPTQNISEPSIMSIRNNLKDLLKQPTQELTTHPYLQYLNLTYTTFDTLRIEYCNDVVKWSEQCTNIDETSSNTNYLIIIIAAFVFALGLLLLTLIIKRRKQKKQPKSAIDYTNKIIKSDNPKLSTNITNMFDADSEENTIVNKLLDIQKTIKHAPSYLKEDLKLAYAMEEAALYSSIVSKIHSLQDVLEKFNGSAHQRIDLENELEQKCLQFSMFQSAIQFNHNDSIDREEIESIGKSAAHKARLKVLDEAIRSCNDPMRKLELQQQFVSEFEKTEYNLESPKSDLNSFDISVLTQRL